MVENRLLGPFLAQNITFSRRSGLYQKKILKMKDKNGNDNDPTKNVDSNISTDANNENEINNDSTVKNYLMCSSDCVEVTCSLLVLVIAVVYNRTAGPFTTRPIPYQRLESTDETIWNLSYNDELKEDTVSDAVLMSVIVFLPMFIQLVLTKIKIAGNYNNRNDFHATICVYFSTIGFTILATDLLKNYCGYLRPSFLDVCQPETNSNDGGSLECTYENIGKYRRSFPSGHASLSFCSMTLFSMYLQQRFGLASIRRLTVSNDDNHNNGNDLEDNNKTIAVHYTYTTNPRWYRIITILCHFPYAIALFVAASRVVDNLHFPADIVGGSVLGAWIAVLIHEVWFPQHMRV